MGLLKTQSKQSVIYEKIELGSHHANSHAFLQKKKQVNTRKI